MLRNEILALIIIELDKANKKCPAFHSTHEGYGVLKEEVDELWDEIKTNKAFDRANRMMVNEAIQVAAMAIKFIECLYLNTNTDCKYPTEIKKDFQERALVAEKAKKIFIKKHDDAEAGRTRRQKC